MSARALALTALLALALLAAAEACGGSSSADLGPYLGEWQRVDGGEPDPSQTLVIQPENDAISAEFEGPDGSFGAPVDVGPDYLACRLPEDERLAALFDGATGLQLSLDQDGQLVVDKVLDDGTTEPVWIYARPASAPVLTPAP